MNAAQNAVGEAAGMANSVGRAFKKTGAKGLNAVDQARGTVTQLAGREEEAADEPGLRCEGCGAPFGLFNRRQTCSGCDRFLCGECMGVAFGLSAFMCLCSSACPKCRELAKGRSEFEIRRIVLEKGVMLSISGGRKPTGAIFGSSTIKRAQVWFQLEAASNEFSWGTLEQYRGRPADSDRIPICEILDVRNTGLAVELSVRGQAKPTVLEFGSKEERDAWEQHLKVAVDVLTPDSQRTEQAAARQTQRQVEMEERRSLNEERKKKLTQNLGMRFTAEAMMKRDASPSKDQSNGRGPTLFGR